MTQTGRIAEEQRSYADNSAGDRTSPETGTAFGELKQNLTIRWMVHQRTQGRVTGQAVGVAGEDAPTDGARVTAAAGDGAAAGAGAAATAAA